MFFVVAASLLALRLFYFGMTTASYLIVTESQTWIYTVLAFSNKYLNRPGRVLTYLSKAAYPVYILHMIFLYLGSTLIFPLPIALPLQFVFVLLFTVGGCLASYELIRRIRFVRTLFGIT
jgi:glucans biosynthesis protein C